MFTLFINPFSFRLLAQASCAIPEAYDELTRLQKMHNCEHNFSSRLDLLEQMHARIVNRRQYRIEHDGLQYWLRNVTSIYNPYQQPAAGSTRVGYSENSSSRFNQESTHSGLQSYAMTA